MSHPLKAKSTIVLSGKDPCMRVVQDRLRLEWGSHRTHDREIMLLDRGNVRVDRIILLANNSGWLTLPAINWCNDLGIALVILNREGEAAIWSNVQLDGRLRRSQVRAAERNSPQGLEVVRYLMTLKCDGQYRNLARLGYGTEELEQLCNGVPEATSLRAVLNAETILARTYWAILSAVEMRWSAKRADAVPDWWKAVGARNSVKTNSPRSAVSPAHALWNFAYALLESEATILVNSVGLDPSLGIVHTDGRRHSFSLDIMEAARPTVDAAMLDMLDTRTFTLGDFNVLPNGIVRISAGLKRGLIGMMPAWRKALAPVVEMAANMLRPETKLGRKIHRTPLTNQNIRRSQEEMRRLRIEAIARMVLEGNESDPTPESWEEIYPLITGLPPEVVTAATGLSQRFVKRIRTGEQRPGKWHWATFYRLGRRYSELQSSGAPE